MLQEFLRLAVYVPVDETGQGADLAVASVHPWEHPLIELDRVSLWMPRAV
jgi:hypothetical protein